MDADESLREAACLGNIHAVRKLIEMGASVNSQNKINGWTPLHWACKRDHADIVQCLIDNKADPSLQTNKGETPSDLTTNEAILNLLPGQELKHDNHSKHETLPFVPNYLKYPKFPYSDVTETLKDSSLIVNTTANQLDDNLNLDHHHHKTNSLLVRARIADSGEFDFVEVDVKELTYSCLVRSCCEELEVSIDDVAKLRKLPNVLIRKDRDVVRLKNEQELELVLFSKETI